MSKIANNGRFIIWAQEDTHRLEKLKTEDLQKPLASKTKLHLLRELYYRIVTVIKNRRIKARCENKTGGKYI